MPPTPTPPTNPTTLPRSLVRTTGPKIDQDSDCLVCWEPLDGPTIEHAGTTILPGCGRRFHEDCLHACYREADREKHIGLRCLLCRTLILAPGQSNPWRPGVPTTSAVRPIMLHPIMDFWRQWASLQSMYIGGSQHNVCAVFQDALPDLNADDLQQEIMSKLASAYESIEANHDLRGLRTLLTTEIMHLKPAFDDTSLQCLYILWRLLGVRDFFLVQADANPNVGVWLPILRTIDPLDLQTFAAVDNEEFRRHERLSRIPRMSFPTAVLCDLMHRFHDMTPAENLERRILLVQCIADEDEVTKWQLLDMRERDVQSMRSAVDPDGQIIAVPCYPDKRSWEEQRADLHDMLRQERLRTVVWGEQQEVEWLITLLKGEMDVAKEDLEGYTRTDPAEGMLARNRWTPRVHGHEAQDVVVVGRTWSTSMTK